MRRPTSLLALASPSLLISLIMLTGAAWALTLYHALSMSMPMGVVVRGGMAAEGLGGMAMGGMAAAGSLGGAVVFVVLWTVAMAAMMLPAALPMIVIFTSAQARHARHAAVPAWVFTAGYLLVWAAAGLLVYVGSDVVTGLAADRATLAPLALGITLLLVGVYQFTPLKRVCLTRCRSPFVSWRSTGAMDGSARSRWDSAMAAIASAAAGRCSR